MKVRHIQLGKGIKKLLKGLHIGKIPSLELGIRIIKKGSNALI
jgi:hypothetical protein